MVKVQLDLPEKEDSQVKHFMIDKKIIDKRIAIIEIVRGYFRVPATKRKEGK